MTYAEFAHGMRDLARERFVVAFRRTPCALAVGVVVGALALWGLGWWPAIVFLIFVTLFPIFSVCLALVVFALALGVAFVVRWLRGQPLLPTK
jgi:hypothetical protein